MNDRDYDAFFAARERDWRDPASDPLGDLRYVIERLRHPDVEGFLAARERDCAAVGLTWDQLVALRKPCGCCFDGPDLYRRIYFAYKDGP
jgi:hypothetical protein